MPIGASFGSGETLDSDHYIESNDGSHYLLMQDNGKLCSYAMDSDSSVWCSSGGGGQGHYVATVRDDGALCVFKNGVDGQEVWCRAPAQGAPPFEVRVSNSGNVKVSGT